MIEEKEKEIQISNNFESKVSIKIETNSRGHNCSIHVYEGVKKEGIDDCIAKAIYTMEQLQRRLASLTEIPK